MTDAPDKRPAFEPAARLLKPTAYDPAMQRPTSTVAGAVLVLLRVVVGVICDRIGRAGAADRAE